MNIKDYDFLDFGASKAASIDYGIKHLFGKKGMGVDLDPVRVKAMNDTGYACMVGDLTDLDLPPRSVRFVKMSHILEHMPNLLGVEKAITSAKKVATEFMVITGPFFDEDEYLRKNGFKLHWSDYPEHTCHLTVEELVRILKKLKLNNYELYLRNKIHDSDSEHIHSLKSPAGSHHYKSELHPRKKRMAFDRDIWTDFVCYVRLQPRVANWENITKAYRHQVPYIEMRSGKKFIYSAEAINRISQLEDELQRLNKKLHDLKVTYHNTKEALIKYSATQQKPPKRADGMHAYIGKARQKAINLTRRDRTRRTK